MLQYEKTDVFYWYFEDVGFRFQLHVCNKCHDVLMTAYDLKTLEY